MQPGIESKSVTENKDKGIHPFIHFLVRHSERTRVLLDIIGMTHINIDQEIGYQVLGVAVIPFARALSDIDSQNLAFDQSKIFREGVLCHR